MMERTKERIRLKPERLAAEPPMGPESSSAGRRPEITPHIPVWDKGDPDDGTFTDVTSSFHERTLTLPGGKGAEADPAQLRGGARRQRP